MTEKTQEPVLVLWYSVIFLFHFEGRLSVSKHFISPNCVSKILAVLVVLPTAMHKLLTALPVSGRSVAKWPTFKFPVRLCSEQQQNIEATV